MIRAFGIGAMVALTVVFVASFGGFGGDSEGKALLRKRCVSCHGLDYVERAKKNKNGWRLTVERMIAKGTKLNEKEKEILIDYLAKKYGSNELNKSWAR
ncbi:conserved hypothetical protein [Thermosulfidibacter takaii ABI70S6]|uniref:Quinohemoprotein amine dehydrogenase alpha subunit haem binding domain-containing protein n=1 Tax=Thermosulfidibacter takaii (strain DSM 17441 / JCM 13301 / NBRC 103674 / ABI70S6) TaxID=1298851 RepID=A0A0S3QT61_THET7|nr:hypothetical protein [Thermosulfidibacter takaii]BAT71495.1 conserved hypothetical protein [Thermosulfidibacter takaii ABI70S6]